MQNIVPNKEKKVYGSLYAKPLDKDALIKGLSRIMLDSSNIEHLIEGGYSDELITADCGVPEIIAAEAASELYSENLLEYLNTNMAPVYASDFGFEDAVTEAEARIGHGIEYVPKIWNKPAVCIGENGFSGGGTVIGLMSCVVDCTYIDTDGDIFGVTEYRFYKLEGGEVPLFVTRVLSDVVLYTADSLVNYFPEKYSDFWDC